MTATKTNEAQITLNPRGTERNTLPLTHVQVPDLWHLATSMPELAEIVRVFREAGPAVDTSLLDVRVVLPDPR